MKPTRLLTPIRLFLVAMALALLVAGPAGAQESKGEAAKAEVKDEAGLFGAEARKKAQEELEKVARERKVPIVIETINSLGGREIDEEAARRFGRAGESGVYLLISKDDRKLSRLRVGEGLASAVPERTREAVRNALVEHFARRDFDGGLERASRVLAEALASAGPEGPGGPLVVRDQVKLTLAGARKALAGAEAKAVEMKWKMNIAVVDDGGHLIAFVRMDGARPASAATAQTKAITAATFRQASGPLPAGSNPDVLLNLSLQNAAAASGGKITTLLGGVPIVVDGQVIGAVGVGGGSGEQDAEVARAGVAAVVDALKGDRAHRD
ncbi:MAG TPA: heme-binding protein [Isosphaeraceae bacterium]|jgi:glc operon protein GlcG|nr:heme-binding protein [Isosphaeraceae bacterium]